MKSDKKILTSESSPVSEPHQSQTLSEEAMFSAVSRVLESDFPNPDRTGCPAPSVLRRIASRQMKLSEARGWLPHLGSCSACYQDFLRFRKQPSQRKSLAIAIGTIAAILCLVFFSMLWLRTTRTRTDSTQIAVLDLRGRSELRSGQAPQNQPSSPVLKLRRQDSEVAVYLPLGSPQALYELEFLDSSTRKQMLLMSTPTQFQDHITMLRISVDSASLPAGPYLLGLRHNNLSWSYYPILLE